jgi:uncharacterized membrane protein YkvA (DUF1232 family)
MSALSQIAGRLKIELAYYRCLISHPKTPKISRVLLGAAIAYFLSPIDVIPDFVPILGHLDDVLIVPSLIWLAMRLVPEEVSASCRSLSGSSIDSPSQRG